MVASTSSTLTNCYVPLSVPASSSTSTPTSPPIDISKNRSSGDGTSTGTRSAKQLRRLVLKTSVLSNSDGSALLELGHTKVLCSVHGPRSAASSSLTGGRAEFNAGGTLNCEVRLAPSFGLSPQTAVTTAISSLDGRSSGGGGGSSTATTPQEIELSARLYDAIAPSVRLDRLPKCAVDVYVMILQGDGSILPGAVTAASLALADAGIELFDLVASCDVAAVAAASADDATTTSRNKPPATLLADPTEAELLQAEGAVTLAILPNWREVTFWDQTGRLSATTSSEAIELCRDGCSTMHRFMRECLMCTHGGQQEGKEQPTTTK